ncbi:MAG: hypothetical protein H6623_07615 [Bdellovibrionaceae bacterium]|nr:hypothetical protein [Pseudobdellovibrionaceae bacterium]
MSTLLVLLSAFIFADVSGLTINDVTAQTNLTEKQIISATESSLESFLYNDGDGISCGLQSFYVVGYSTLEDVSNMTQFTVTTEVEGPKGVCKGYETYNCYTKWQKKNDTWDVLNTDCDEGYLYED